MSKSYDRKSYGVADVESLDIYLEEIGETPLLSRKEEVEIAKNARDGDKRSLDLLVKANLKFVVSMAKQYQNIGLPLKDLISEGNLGIMKAVSRFDVERGYKFISYARWWIKQSILQAIAENKELPLHKIEELQDINEIIKDIKNGSLKNVSSEEISDHFEEQGVKGYDRKKIDSLRISGYRRESLEENFENDPDERNLLDIIPIDIEPVDEEAMDNQLKDDVNQTLVTLPPKESEVIELYFGINKDRSINLEEIGTRFGLTRERIRQIKEKAIERLRYSSRSEKLEQHLD